MVRSIRRNHFAWVGLACLVLILSLGAREVRGADLDAQSILGEWQGTWAMASSRSSTGNYYITINKVEGEKVMGQERAAGLGQDGGVQLELCRHARGERDDRQDA